MNLNTKNTKRILLIILFGAIVFSAFQNFGTVLNIFGKCISVFSPVIAALCIAFVLNVLLAALETKVFAFLDKSKKKFIKKLKRPLCLTLTYVIALGIVAMLILVIIPDIVDTISYIADKMPKFAEDFRKWAVTTLEGFNIDEENIPDFKIDWHATANSIKSWISGSTSQIVGSAFTITTSVFSGIFDTIFSLVISVYILAQKEKIGGFIRRVISAFLPSKSANFIYHIAGKTHYYFSRFIGGQLIEALILGTLCFIGMTIFGFPNALIISALICVTALVPIVGATIGIVVGFLLILISNPIKALLFIVFLFVLQQIEGNLIYPRVVGRAVGLPGVLVVSAVLVGGNIGGVVGALIAVPTVALFFALLKDLMEFSSKSSGNKVESSESSFEPPDEQQE